MSKCLCSDNQLCDECGIENCRMREDALRTVREMAQAGLQDTTFDVTRYRSFLVRISNFVSAELCEGMYQ